MTRRKHTHATSYAPSLLTPLPSCFFLPSPLLSNSLISRSIKVMAIHKHFSLQHSVSPLTRLTPCPSTANPPFQHTHDKQGPPSWRMVRQNESNKIMANAIFGIFTPSRRKRGKTHKFRQKFFQLCIFLPSPCAFPLFQLPLLRPI